MDWNFIRPLWDALIAFDACLDGVANLLRNLRAAPAGPGTHPRPGARCRASRRSIDRSPRPTSHPTRQLGRRGPDGDEASLRRRAHRRRATALGHPLYIPQPTLACAIPPGLRHEMATDAPPTPRPDGRHQRSGTGTRAPLSRPVSAPRDSIRFPGALTASGGRAPRWS